MLKDINDVQQFQEVLIYYSNGTIAPTWGGICGTTNDDYDAKVVCRQLGYTGGVTKTARYACVMIIMHAVELKAL